MIGAAETRAVAGQLASADAGAIRSSDDPLREPPNRRICPSAG